jgi:uncharacterized coiled-coil protein SlyX
MNRKKENERKRNTITISKGKKILAKNKFEDEIEVREAEVNEKISSKEKELSEREIEIARKEKELNTLSSRIDKFDEEIKLAVDSAVKESETKAGLEYKNKEDLLVKDFEGKENVYQTKIQNLERVLKEQEKKIDELSAKLDTAYQKVQDVAIKAIDGAANLKSFNDLQKIFSEKAVKKSDN